MSSDKRTDAVYMAKVSPRLAVARRRCACLVLTLEYTTLRAMQQQQQQLSEQAERYDEMVSSPSLICLAIQGSHISGAMSDENDNNDAILKCTGRFDEGSR